MPCSKLACERSFPVMFAPRLRWGELFPIRNWYARGADVPPLRAGDLRPGQRPLAVEGWGLEGQKAMQQLAVSPSLRLCFALWLRVPCGRQPASESNQ